MRNLVKLITLCVIFQISNLASAYDFEVDGIYYNIISLSELTCEVTSGDNKYNGDIKIPGEIEYQSRTLSVIGIGECAFSYCESLKSVNASNVLSIGEAAFKECYSLVSVDFPNATDIGDRAFYYCSSLVSANFPNATDIGDDSFYYCRSLVSADFPNANDIGISAFEGCSSLVSADFPNATDIGSLAFDDCYSLVSADFPNASYIGYKSFSYCSSLVSADFPNATYIGSMAFECCSSLISADFPNVTDIGSWAFADCSSLESITFPKLVKISDCMLNNCSSLKSLNISRNLNSIIQFNGYYKDKEISVTFHGCSFKELIFEYSEEILYSECIIRKPFDEYNYYSVGFSSDLYSVTYDDVLFEIVETSGKLLSVEKVYIDRPVNTFLSFGDLKELTLGEHINSIQVNTPSETLICLGSTPIPISDDYFSNSDYLNLIVKVPKDALKDYQNASGWKNFWNLQTLEDTTGIEDITSGIKVKEIGRYDLNGRTVSEDYKGIIIIHYSDGSTRKMIIK